MARVADRQFALIFVIVLLSSAISGTTANIGIYMATFFWGFTTEDLRWFALASVGALIAFRWSRQRSVVGTRNA